MSIYQAVLELVGPVPAGYEILCWLLAGIILVYLLCSAFSVIASIINWIGGK